MVLRLTELKGSSAINQVEYQMVLNFFVEMTITAI